MPDQGVVVVPLDGGPELPIIERNGRANAAIWPGMGAEHRSVHRIVLDSGGVTKRLRHGSEAVYFIARGRARVTYGNGHSHELTPGSMVHVQPSTAYAFHAGEDYDGTEIIGGPCPPDPALYAGFEGDADPAGEAGDAGAVRVFHRDRADFFLTMLASDARAVVWPGVGVYDAPMFYGHLKPGEQNPPHKHPYSEDTLVILAGEGTIENVETSERIPIRGGDVIQVAVGVVHRLMADRGSRIETVGAPAPADLEMLRMAGADV